MRSRAAASIVASARRTGARTRSCSSAASKPEAEKSPGMRAGPQCARCRVPRRDAHACSGPPPPNATSVKSRGSSPRSMRNDAQHLGHRVVDERHDARGSALQTHMSIACASASRSRRARARRRLETSPPSRCCGIKPSEHDVRIGDGRTIRFRRNTPARDRRRPRAVQRATRRRRRPTRSFRRPR